MKFTSLASISRPVEGWKLAIQYKKPMNIDIQKFGIKTLTPMQQQMGSVAMAPGNVVLLSPTGTGKTLAFLLPLLQLVQSDAADLQAVVIVPTRELAQQNEEVLRRGTSGIKSMSLYGGRPAMDEHRVMKELHPQVIFATPGRMNDHLDKGNLDAGKVRVLVIDEFDKCVELGFQNEMERLISRFSAVTHCWLTSATDAESLPAFVERVGEKRGRKWNRLDYLTSADDVKRRMQLGVVKSPLKDKLHSLGLLLTAVKGLPSIVFVAHRESADRVGKWLKEEGFTAEIYHGGLEQDQRERALYKFRSGASNVLVSTDLAARGLDIPEVKVVVHYHLPLREEDFTHRNGRTARWDAEGEVYLIQGPEETLPEYAADAEVKELPDAPLRPVRPKYVSLYIGRGKRDKLSKADVLGFFCKKGGASASDIGRIDIGPHHAYVSILRSKVKDVLRLVVNEKIKGMKTLIEEMRR